MHWFISGNTFYFGDVYVWGRRKGLLAKFHVHFSVDKSDLNLWSERWHLLCTCSTFCSPSLARQRGNCWMLSGDGLGRRKGVTRLWDGASVSLRLWVLMSITASVQFSCVLQVSHWLHSDIWKISIAAWITWLNLLLPFWFDNSMSFWAGNKTKQRIKCCVSTSKSNRAPSKTLLPVDNCTSVFLCVPLGWNLQSLQTLNALTCWSTSVWIWYSSTSQPPKLPAQMLQFRCLIYLLFMSRFPTWSACPMADQHCRSPLGILVGFPTS